MSKNKAELFHFGLYGKREDKYNFLNGNSTKSVWIWLFEGVGKIPLLWSLDSHTYYV